MLASSSMVPVRVKTAPRPQLRRGLFSRRVMAWVAASREEAPVVRRRAVERRVLRREVV